MPEPAVRQQRRCAFGIASGAGWRLPVQRVPRPIHIGLNMRSENGRLPVDGKSKHVRACRPGRRGISIIVCGSGHLHPPMPQRPTALDLKSRGQDCLIKGKSRIYARAVAFQRRYMIVKGRAYQMTSALFSVRRIRGGSLFLHGTVRQPGSSCAPIAMNCATALGRHAPILIDQEGGRVTRMKTPVFPEHKAPATFGELWRLDPEKSAGGGKAECETSGAARLRPRRQC